MSIVWKDVVGYEGTYKVSNTGLVKKLETIKKSRKGNSFNRPERILKLIVRPTGYVYVGLGKYNGHTKLVTANVHRLVAKAFLPNPLGKRCVNHKDFNKANNNVSNLEWHTHAENNLHACSNKVNLGPIGERNRGVKLSEEDVLDIRRLAGVYSSKEIAKLYPVSYSSIRNIITRITWKHI